MKTIKFFIGMFLVSTLLVTTSFAQTKQSITVLSIETKGLITDNATMTNLVRMEFEKTNRYEVLDKYDVNDAIKKNGVNVDECFGKSCLVKIGKELNADNMLTGSAERIGEKIIITLKIINVQTESVVNANVTEYLNQQAELQHMVRISINNLLGIENDPNIVNMLVEYDVPLTSPKTKVKLNGTRMGATYVAGESGEIMMDSEENGGFDMLPVSSMFGYQYEVQYLSAGDFQGLFEFFGAVNGLESGKVVPAIAIMNGFRFNKGGYEFGVGPSFRLVKKAEVFKYDIDSDGKRERVLRKYYDSEIHVNPDDPGDINWRPDFYEALDSRGSMQLSTGLIIAVGKTFRSGYLNMPVNIYVQPRKEGLTCGFSIGFNLAKKPKL